MKSYKVVLSEFSYEQPTRYALEVVCADAGGDQRNFETDALLKSIFDGASKITVTVQKNITP
jgi:hypothetical protein